MLLEVRPLPIEGTARLWLHVYGLSPRIAMRLLTLECEHFLVSDRDAEIKAPLMQSCGRLLYMCGNVYVFCATHVVRCMCGVDVVCVFF